MAPAPPLQIEVSPLVAIVGKAFGVTVTVELIGQDPKVAVAVYVRSTVDLE